MNIAPTIRHLSRAEIDTVKWDLCVKNAPNGFLYSQSFYLDGVGMWSALVMGDYQYVMPLPRRRKFWINYIYIPPFTGQLGIIGNQPFSQELSAQFIRAIPATFVVADLLMNEQNVCGPLKNASTSSRTNYTISLAADYETLSSNYSKDAKKNLRNTKRLGLHPSSGVSVGTVIKMYKAAYGKKNKHISSKDYTKFEALAEKCMDNGNGFTLGIFGESGELLASAIFGLDSKRVYYILGAPTKQGRTAKATHCLIDEAIKMHAGKDLKFDFEGSDISSVAQFYEKFAPKKSTFHIIRIRKLAGWIEAIRNIFITSN